MKMLTQFSEYFMVYCCLQAIDQWERVTVLILQREELLVKLEKFERVASDPNRFFEKGKYSKE